jgi:hypothetical protein
VWAGLKKIHALRLLFARTLENVLRSRQIMVAYFLMTNLLAAAEKPSLYIISRGLARATTSSSGAAAAAERIAAI